MIDPITREEILLAKALGENVPDIVPIIRKEMYLAKIAGADISTPEAITREEMYLDAIANGTECTLAPITRKEMFYAKAAGQDVQTPAPITRIEMLLSQIAGSGGGGEQPVYHTVKFYNGDVLLGSVQVLHGKSASYTGDTPVKGEGYEFNGWNPAPTNVTADMDCYAQFKSTALTWADVSAYIADGTYKDNLSIGDTVPLDLGTEGVVNMQIVAFDADEKADGSGNAPITWISQGLLATKHVMNSSSSSTTYWDRTTLHTYLNDTLLPTIPTDVRSAILPVVKYHQIRRNSGVKQGSCTDSLWIPSVRELNGTSATTETSGAVYATAFPSDDSRKKKRPGYSTDTYWTRSGHTNQNEFFTVYSTGGLGNNSSTSNERGVAIGFCT